MLLGSRRCSAWLQHGLVWSSVLLTRPSTSGMDGCAPAWELMDNNSNICSEPQTSLFDWLYCFMTLLRLRVWHALKLLLALQGTVATCKARFGGLSDVKVLLQNSSDMCLLKIIKLDDTWQTCCTQWKGHLLKQCKQGKWIIFVQSTVNRCFG